MRTSAGKADITLRWPSDEEWAAQRKRRHVIQTQLGRGTALTEIDRAEADLKLYETVKMDGAPPLTASEATYIIERVEQCDVRGLELGADEAVLDLEIYNGNKVKHTVGIPTMDQMRNFQRTTKVYTLQYNRVEMRASIDASARLWDECQGRAEGYAGPVPNIHKDVAIRAVIQAIDDENKPKYDEANF
jgi:hypothetical protein